MKIVRRGVFKLLLVAILLVQASGCSFVEEDMSSCPTCPKGLWLQLAYTYNMLDVNAAEKQVKQASVFIFNKNGQFQVRQNFDFANLETNGWRVKIEGLSAGSYHFMVWGGLDDPHYKILPPATGDSMLDGYTMNLLADSANVVNSRCMPLFYGFAGDVEYDADSYVVQSVGLIKDTKILSCLIADEYGSVSSEDYSITVSSLNSVLDSKNRISGNDIMLYMPYSHATVEISDKDKGTFQAAKYELNTLRLMKGDDSRLIIQSNIAGKELLNISLSELLTKSAPLYQDWSEQEYLDRQDYYTLIFYLDKNNAITSVRVNGWILRLDDNIELS